MIYFDEQNTVCRSTDIIVEADKKVEDVQIAQVYGSNTSLQVKFVITYYREFLKKQIV